MRFFNRLVSPRLREIARATVFPQEHADSKRQFIVIYFIRLCFLVGRRLWRDKCLRQSAALAFQTLLSLVPLLVLAVAVAATLELDAYRDRLIDYLNAQLVPDAAGAASRRVSELAGSISTKTLGVLGGATLLVISMTLLFNIEQVVNEIFHAPRSRPMLARIAIALVLILGLPMAVGASLYFTGTMLVLPRLLHAAVPLVFTTIALFLAYWLLPHTRISKHLALVSAVVAGVLLEGVKIGFAFYAKYLGVTLSYVYGAFAIFPLFMIWIYVAWVIFLFGAEFNAALHEVRHHEHFTS